MEGRLILVRLHCKGSNREEVVSKPCVAFRVAGTPIEAGKALPRTWHDTFKVSTTNDLRTGFTYTTSSSASNETRKVTVSLLVNVTLAFPVGNQQMNIITERRFSWCKNWMKFPPFTATFSTVHVNMVVNYELKNKRNWKQVLFIKHYLR